jgi:hypothetical protein
MAPNSHAGTFGAAHIDRNVIGPYSNGSQWGGSNMGVSLVMNRSGTQTSCSTIYGNTFNGTSGYAQWGIEVSSPGPAGVSVEQNTMTNVDAPITIGQAVGTEIENNTLTNWGNDSFHSCAYNKDGGYNATEWIGTNTLNGSQVTGDYGCLGHGAYGQKPAVCTPSTPYNTTPDFTLTATPNSQTVVPGGSTTYTATVSPLNGFTGTVSLSVSGCPTGATCTFNPTSITGGSGNSTLTAATTTSTAAGSYTLTLTGASGSLSHSTTVTLVVQGSPDFTLTATPNSQTVVPGGSTTYTATVSPLNGFTGTVSLSVSGCPTGATCTFNPTSITGGSGSSTLSVSTTTSTPVGSSTLTITGTSGSLTHNTTVTLVVQSSSGTVQTVQHKSGTIESGTSVAVVFTSNVTAGNKLLVAVGAWVGQTINAPTDSRGNAYTQLVTANGGNAVAAIYIATANSTGADTVTCSTNVTGNIHCHIYEVSGTTGTADAVGGSLQTSATALSVSTSAATTNANDYILAFFAANNVSATYTVGTGYGNTETTNNVAGKNGDTGFSEDKVATTTGVQTATATASTADTFTNVIVALR